jgi:2-polyprenyl-3-methyl-5-hydroxy-6-metoxy-1,4-benzoquinol methylase
MKNARVIEMYNRFFADGGFGEKPSPIVEALPKFISSGNVLDIGAGDGGNSLYLASQGFNVTANDISSVAIQKIIKKGEAAGIPIQTQVGVFTEMDLNHEFDAIICTFVMHHFSRAEAERAIKKCNKAPNKVDSTSLLALQRKVIVLREALHSLLTLFILIAKKSSKASIRIGIT